MAIGQASGAFVGRYDPATGNPIWETQLPPSRDGQSNHAVALTDSGKVAVLSLINPRGLAQLIPQVSVLDLKDGKVLWQHKFAATAFPSAQFTTRWGIAVDKRGRFVAVTGFAKDATGQQAIWVSKLDVASGAMVWSQSLNPNQGKANAGSFVAFDGQGDVLVAGGIGVRNPHYFVGKFAGSDGVLKWSNTYVGPSNYYDEARAMTVDKRGNVIVGGMSPSADLKANWHLAAFNGADGKLLWETRETGVGGVIGSLEALTADSHGDVLATGAVFPSAGAKRAITTAKYDGQTGKLKWGYARPTGNDKSAEGKTITLDKCGHAFIAGTLDLGRGYDVAIFSLDGTTGQPRWEHVYDSEFHATDRIAWPNNIVAGPEHRITISADSWNPRTPNLNLVQYQEKR